MSDLIAQLKALVDGLPPDQQAAAKEGLIQQAAAFTGHIKWIPNDGPQTAAFNSQADVMLYGGQAGGGKSALGLGLALTSHHRSLVMRRRYNDLSALTEEAIKFHGTRNGFSAAPSPRLKTNDGRLIEFGACQHLGDEEAWQGRPHDLIYIDEPTHFLEQQIRFLMAWNRPTGDNPSQRCRVVLGSNPPLSSEGDWIISMFAPWLDPTYPEPAVPGELRWVVTDEQGKDMWVKGPAPVLVGDKMATPLSRTFIPASLRDNPFLAQSNYKAMLDSLPEPMRSAMRDGNFMAGRQDDELQVIPTAWVRAAQERWTPDKPDVPMCAMGVDPAKGGIDETTIAPRYDGWYAPLVVTPGKDTPEGSDTAALVVINRRHSAIVVIDVGGGYGDAAFALLRGNLETSDGSKAVVKFDGSASSTARTAGKTLPFKNKRAEAIWKFREALDPDQDGGSPIMLPPDSKILADLCSYRLLPRALESGVIQIESKQEMKVRLGRSPDRGDAIMMAWSEGNKAMTHAATWHKYRGEAGGMRRRPEVQMGYEARRRPRY